MLWKVIGTLTLRTNQDLKMIEYSRLTLDEIRVIGSQYDIEEIRSCEILSGGSENTNYLVNTNNDAYVLTISEQKSMKKTKDLADLLEYLVDNDFSTSKIIRNKNSQSLGVWNGKPVMLKEYLRGKVMEDLPHHLVEYLGQQLGKLHNIKAPAYLPTQLSYGIECFDDLKIYAESSEFYLWLKEIEDLVQRSLSPRLPKAMIHSDVFFNNVIVSKDENRATIMDFEEASFYYRVFDLGMIIVGVCSIGEAVDLDKVGVLLRGYQRENKLLELELDSLNTFTVYAAACTAFWRHKHFNYVEPVQKMADHYLAMKHLADHVRALPNDSFRALPDD